MAGPRRDDRSAVPDHREEQSRQLRTWA